MRVDQTGDNRLPARIHHRRLRVARAQPRQRALSRLGARAIAGLRSWLVNHVLGAWAVQFLSLGCPS